MKLLLIRHGHVEGVYPQRFRGRKEVPLTELGIRQAKATARRIAAQWRVDALYTSPMGRTIETGKAIGEVCGVEGGLLEGLIDFDYGAWSWRLLSEVEEEAPALFQRWFSAPQLVQIPSGDTLQELAARSADALRTMLSRHADETVVAVAHDSVNRALLLQLLDMPFSGYWRIAQDPCCINEIDIEDGQVHVRRINETGHLLGLDEDVSS
ncbi:histidine phosphatase family protein [Sphingomonas sp. H39-1-10]|uniref:histidine phosphatase family protein n=1 Tax=Sphingomonas pollutisoli TaxID=3030829 RepID=UPI0023B88DC9|nr:histidine phosphatase family protein [Sphingomonas pollutisoli]MDF0490535.1 histidine phosphatase family protein [Sphingomonas pollutisoli]